MRVTLNRLNRKVHLRAVNGAGNSADIDGAEHIGGENLGFRPMQLVLAAAGSCVSMDLIPILAKQRQDLDDIQVTVDGKRAEGVVPSPFTEITLHFDLIGRIDPGKARRAIELALYKYCSVEAMLRHSVDIGYSFAINPAERGRPDLVQRRTRPHTIPAEEANA